MTGVTLWHNPRCSKSRGALQLLQGRGISPTIRHYLHDAPSIDELRAVVAKLRVPVNELMRTGEGAYKELGLDPDSSDDVLLKAMAANPRLIQRPILVTGTRAVIGRPPERILDLL